MMALFGPATKCSCRSRTGFSYPEQVRLAGAKPIELQAAESNGFKLTALELDAAVGSKTKGIILNYP
jgi:aspartate aminotransferase